FLDQDLIGQFNQVFLDFSQLGFDNDLAVPPFDLSKGNYSINFGNYRRIRWITCFEQFGNPRKTPCNIPGLCRFTWNLDQGLTFFDLIAVIYHNMRSYRKVI